MIDSKLVLLNRIIWWANKLHTNHLCRITFIDSMPQLHSTKLSNSTQALSRNAIWFKWVRNHSFMNQNTPNTGHSFMHICNHFGPVHFEYVAVLAVDSKTNENEDADQFAFSNISWNSIKPITSRWCACLCEELRWPFIEYTLFRSIYTICCIFYIRLRSFCRPTDISLSMQISLNHTYFSIPKINWIH